MPGLFEQFPHTNFHELNLDWMIDLLNTFKDELENRAVLSVNGMTGEVTLYESENVVLPPLTNTSSWRLVRMMDGQYVGVLFQDGHVWLQQGNSTLKLLTTEDIPTSAGVVSINGLGGIVRLTGADIPIDNSEDPDSIRLALENESTARQNADTAINQALTTERTDRANADNAISNRITNLIKSVRFPIQLDADGNWGSWNYSLGYDNYQLIKAYATTWNKVTVYGDKDGFWSIHVDGIASQTVEMIMVIVYSVHPAE